MSKSPLKALHDSRDDGEVRYLLQLAARQRAIAASTRPDHRTRRCPGCGAGLKIRVMPPTAMTPSGQTILVCPGCSWTHTLPFAMDEGRLPGEPYIPGVTGRPRGRVVMTIDGKHVKVVD